MIPFAVDAFDGFGLQSKRVDFSRRAKHSGDDRDVESFNVFENQCGTFLRRNFFEQLTTDRGNFPILIDLFADPFKFAMFFQGRDVFAQIAGRP